MICNDVSQWIGSPKRTTAAQKNLAVGCLTFRSYLLPSIGRKSVRCDRPLVFSNSHYAENGRSRADEEQNIETFVYQLSSMGVIDHV